MHISINVFAEPGSQQQDYPIVTYNDYFQGNAYYQGVENPQTNGCSAGSNQFQQVLLGNTLEYPQRAGAMWDLKKVRTLPPPMPNFELSCELLKDPDPKVLGSEANSLEDTVEDISPGTPSILKGLPFPPPVVHEDPPSVDFIDTLKDLYDEDWWKEILLDTPTETDMFFQSISPFNDVTQNILGANSPLFEPRVEEQCNIQNGTATQPWEIMDETTPGAELTAQSPCYSRDGALRRPWEL